MVCIALSKSRPIEQLVRHFLLAVISLFTVTGRAELGAEHRTARAG